jgi:hypothetical protein
MELSSKDSEQSEPIMSRLSPAAISLELRKEMMFSVEEHLVESLCAMSLI